MQDSSKKGQLAYYIAFLPTILMKNDVSREKSPALFGAGDTFFLLFVALQKRSSRLDLALLYIARALLVAAELIGELAETAA